MKKTIILSLLSFTTLAGHADEGMWMLTDLKEQNAATMYDMGLDIGIDKVYCPDSISLKDAVVHFGGGCTGEVISAESNKITVKEDDGKVREYKLTKFARSNQSNCYNQRPIVFKGQKVAKGEVIADGPSTSNCCLLYTSDAADD